MHDKSLPGDCEVVSSITFDFFTIGVYIIVMELRKQNNMLKSLWHNQVFRHVLYWLITYAFFFMNILLWDTALIALKISTILVLPGPVPVYLHFYAQKKFFDHRRYLQYALSLVVIVVISAFLIEVVFRIIENDPNARTSGLATAIGYIIITTGFKYYRLGLKQQHRLQEAEFKQLQTELSLLKSQVNPHFFFNTLNNLYALSLDKSERVPEVILKISDLMRYVLESSKRKTVPLTDEVHFLESYVALEKLRLSGNADIQMSVNGNLDGTSIAPMLLAPFIENSFKHGMNTSAKGGYIHIQFDVGSHDMHFTIENSKPLSSKLEQNGSARMGLENVKRRLDLLYPDTHELSIQEDETKHRVDLSIRL